MMSKLTTTNVLRRTVVIFFVLLTGAMYVVMGKNENKENPFAQYAEKISKSYDLKFGANPFLPSNATTVTGSFIPSEYFIASNRCAKCHADTHAQWQQSAHRNAFREPFYQKNVKDLTNQRGIEFTRHCEACHNPAALFTGALTKEAKLPRPFDDDGVSCIACHSMEQVNGQGIGGYVMGIPALLVKADGTRLHKASDQQIMNDIPAHRRAMMRPLLKSPEFCASCHKSQVPQQLNDYKFIRAFAVGDEYQMSSFSKESPHPFYVRDKETCNSCHMKKAPALKYDAVAAARDGQLAAHRWAAANTAIPTFYKWPDQLNAVKKMLGSDVVGVDIFALHKRAARNGDGNTETINDIIAPLNKHSFTINAGEALTVDVVITNKNIGHSFPPELRDFYEAWIEFTVTDDNDKAIYRSGFLKPNGYVDDSAHNYKAYLVNQDGSYNDLHHIWKTRVLAQNNAIQAGRSDVARYQFTVPQNYNGALKLKARVQYRRFTRIFQDYALGKLVDYPIVTMATTEYTMRVGENSPVEVKGTLADWQRWNNYGIALFDHRQFALAADVFGQVVSLDEAYRPMAMTNRALALIELDRYDEAGKWLDKVVSAHSNNMRAVFQQARVFIKFGKLAEAEANLKRVLEAYPRDRLSWQQLGELYKIRRDYDGAQRSYEQVLRIDPEDASAHYNLMLIFRKLGRNEAAAREARLFADLKDDPAVLPIANEFLRLHPEMSNESVPFHVHILDR
jgi:Tfp pilus assembly protein PilF/nitrate/TMAO reductase-like tetraheme cytochrome c subunit